MGKRFIFNTFVAVNAETEGEAARLIEDFFPTEGWASLSPYADCRIEVYDPDWPHVDVYDDEEDGPTCICPPDLVARGGFKGGCPVHSLTRSSGKGDA